jgi:hypothetical protein
MPSEPRLSEKKARPTPAQRRLPGTFTKESITDKCFIFNSAADYRSVAGAPVKVIHSVSQKCTLEMGC